jgi:hypothetical protein
MKIDSHTELITVVEDDSWKPTKPKLLNA